MFSSGLFGSCCSWGWDGADCYSSTLPQGHSVRQPAWAEVLPALSWLAQANKLEGGRTHFGLVQTGRAGDRSGW